MLEERLNLREIRSDEFALCIRIPKGGLTIN